jgi:molecular chaperone DnaJ
LAVEIPAGIEDGATRTVPQAGNRVRIDKPPGNLELVIRVGSHPFFRRVADDVVCKVPISFAQAALGGEIDIPSLSGKLKVRVPPATQSGAVLRVRGKGFPYRVRTGRGDQLVEVSVEIPSRLTDRARELIEELGRELGEDVQPQQHSFLEKLRGLFG